jgi:hypothetical protein
MFFLLQVGVPEPTMPFDVVALDWRLLVAMFINTGLVGFGVTLLTRYMPILKQQYPYLIPIIAACAAPFIAAVTNLLASWLGYPIDLGPILAVLTGTTAVFAHQVGKQIQKSRA